MGDSKDEDPIEELCEEDEDLIEEVCEYLDNKVGH